MTRRVMCLPILYKERMEKEPKNKNIVNDAIIKNIARALDGLEFGAITIKVHDSKIIQIEVTEKRRFDDVWSIGEGGGI